MFHCRETACHTLQSTRWRRLSDRIAGCFGGLCPCLRDAYSPPPLHVSPASKAQETIEERDQTHHMFIFDLSGEFFYPSIQTSHHMSSPEEGPPGLLLLSSPVRLVGLQDRGQVEAQIRSLRRSILRRRGTPEANPQARKKTDKVLSHYEEVLQSLEVRLKELDHELHELGSGRVILSKIWSATARSI
eukprot:g3344.t1